MEYPTDFGRNANLKLKIEKIKQAVGAQVLDMIVAVVRIIPSNDTFAQYRQSRNVSVCNIYISAYTL